MKQILQSKEYQEMLSATEDAIKQRKEQVYKLESMIDMLGKNIQQKRKEIKKLQDEMYALANYPIKWLQTNEGKEND